MNATAQRLSAVRDRITAAALRAGRSPEEIRLVAVSKGQPAARVAEAVEAGCTDIGENYVQELLGKMAAVSRPDVRWHLVGPLQRNKAKHVAGRVALLHTLDSAALAAELDRRAPTPLEVLCEVNVAREPQKHGVLPEALPDLLRAARGCARLVLRGLMTLPPLAATAEEARRWFQALRMLRDDMRRRFPDLDLAELSMGMSGDFEVAIEEGATLVRVGTAIFGARPAKEVLS